MSEAAVSYKRGDLTLEALKTRLPELRGRLEAGVPLAPVTWFRVGGPAEFLFVPADEADLAYFLANRPPQLPVMAIGLGSNLLVRDGGITGVVIRFSKAFAGIARRDEAGIEAGVMAADVRVALSAGEWGIGGLSFLRGVPGAMGGALKMNAGAYGAEIRDVFASATGFDLAGRPVHFDHADMGFSYRHTAVPDDVILTSCMLRGTPGADPAKLSAEMQKITEERGLSQPVKSRTGGSTFKNPPGQKAWQLIDAAGCRGLVVGRAQVSEKHANFLINLGDATAEDIETLGETVRARVKEKTGVTLEWEIRRVGDRPERG